MVSGIGEGVVGATGGVAARSLLAHLLKLAGDGAAVEQQGVWSAVDRH